MAEASNGKIYPRGMTSPSSAAIRRAVEFLTLWMERQGDREAASEYIVRELVTSDGVLDMDEVINTVAGLLNLANLLAGRVAQYEGAPPDELADAALRVVSGMSIQFE